MRSDITIIIPAYNAGDQLPACLDSLFSQTKMPRILIANDGSTDHTSKIADAVAGQSEYVQVLHLSHQGLIATRKASVNAVQTPYFAFLDADDRVEPAFVEEMFSAIIQHNADLVFCSYRCVYDGEERHVSYGGGGTIYAEREYPLRHNPPLLLSMPTFFWGKLYRTDFFRSRIQFATEESKYLEDIVALVPLLIDTPRMAKVDKPLYRYAISSDSMSRVSKQELSRLTAMRVLHERLERMGALPAFLPQLSAINRCYLFDQLEKMRWYLDPPHQHRVVSAYFEHLNKTLPNWKPHPFHPSFYAGYWHGLILWNALKRKMTPFFRKTF